MARLNTPAMLKINDLTVGYGAITAVKGLTLEVREGEIVSLIGSNGAGKSTTLRTVSGLLKPKTAASNSLAKKSTVSLAMKLWLRVSVTHQKVVASSQR
jgi:ABC-type branched-subunit amino acid transport system ATPase component